MSDYLDTSVVLASLLPEEHGPRVREWLSKRPDGGLAVSFWSIAEVPSALSRRVRMEMLSTSQRDQVVAAWDRMRTASFVTLAVEAGHFITAAAYVARHELGLRAPDALHLAVASANGQRVVTLDATMAAAASALGVSVLAL